MTFPIRIKQAGKTNTYSIFVANEEVAQIESDWEIDTLNDHYRLENVLLRYFSEEDDSTDLGIIARINGFMAGLEGQPWAVE